MCSIIKSLVRDNADSNFLRLNIGGQSFRPPKATLQKLDHTLLAKFSISSHAQAIMLCDEYITETNEYYFDRSAYLFKIILDRYINPGVMVLPIGTIPCLTELEEELRFWKIIPPARSGRLSVIPEEEATGSGAIVSIRESISEDDNQQQDDTTRPHQDVERRSLRSRMWTIMEKPIDSAWGKVFFVISNAFLLLSVSVLVLSSVPEYRQITLEYQTEAQRIIHLIDCICVIWFTFEYILRVWAVPNRGRFMASMSNIMELTSIVPFYIEIFIIFMHTGSKEIGPDAMQSFVFIRMARVSRFMRALQSTFRATQQNYGFHAIRMKAVRNISEILVTSSFMLVACLMFSTALYCVENENPKSNITTIPVAAWFCITSMATVGYGDIYPITPGGQIVASLSCICGILLLAFPVSILVRPLEDDIVLEDGTIINQKPKLLGEEYSRSGKKRRRKSQA